MKIFALFAALTAGLLVHPDPAVAQRPAAAQGFDAFRMVRTRNIFDPDRRPPPSQNAGSASAVPIAQSDYVALTGTLVTDEKSLAFFSGSRADFDKVLPVKERIAGATITKIQPGSVTIERAGKAVTVAVGWTVPLSGSASAPAPVPDAMPPVSAAAAAAPVAAGAPAAPAPLPAGLPLPFGMANPPGGGTTARATAPATPIATPNPDVARMMRERRLQEQQ